jgi:hypothetical protein
MRSPICIDCEEEDCEVCPVPSQSTIRIERVIRDELCQPLPTDPQDELSFYEESLRRKYHGGLSG